MIKRTFIWESNNPPPQNYIWVKSNGRAYEYNPDKREWVLSNLFNYDLVERLQVNWSEQDPRSSAFIKNKPNLEEFALKSKTYTKEEIQELLNGIDLSNFPTMEEINIAISLKQDAIEDLDEIRENAQLGLNAYQKPINGIPESDLSDSVKSLLNKANTALQSFTETDPTVPSWAKSSTKPTYTAQEVGALPANTSIPINLSDLREDSNHRLVTDAEKSRWESKSGFSGDYNDLQNKPNIPQPQVQSDWNQTNSLSIDFIKNKPSIPTSLSDFNQDSTHRFVTDSEKSVWNEKQDVISDLNAIRSGANEGSTAYQKPSTGIPSSDLSSEVQQSLTKADTALQSFTESDPTVPAWAKTQNKPTYTANEVGALPSNTPIPSNLSDLSNVDNTTPTNGQTLVYDDSTNKWKPASLQIVSGVTVDTSLSNSSENPVQNKVITNALNNKVDKIEGQGLSKNNYTDEDKAKLGNIAPGAEVNTISTVKVNGTALTPDANKAVDVIIPGPKIFVAVYGTTTFSDVLAAYSAGKTVVMKDEDTILFATYIDENVACFSGIGDDKTCYYAVLNEIGWEEIYTYPIPEALSQLSDSPDYRLVTDAEKTAWNAKYDKPGTGIPASDLASGVIPDVSGKADKSDTPRVVSFEYDLDELPGEIIEELRLGDIVSCLGDPYEVVNKTPTEIRLSMGGWFYEFTKSNGVWSYSRQGEDLYSKPSGGIPKADLAEAVQTSLGKADTALQSQDIPSVPIISTNITEDASSDVKTASPKAIKTYVDSQIPSVPIISTSISTDANSDIKTTSPKAVKNYVDGIVPTVPEISTDIFADALSDTKTVSPKAVKTMLDTKQDTLVSNGNIKTINNTSILGSGNLTINDGKSAYEIWQDEGGQGSASDFLASLQGNSGYSGAAGDLQVVNSLTTGGTTDALSAEMGKQLKLQVDAAADRIQDPPVDALLYDLTKVNLYDPSDLDIQVGKYFSDATGTLSPNLDFLVTGYIPFTPSMGKVIASVNGTPMNESGGFLILYDSQGNVVDGYQENRVGGIAEWEDKVAFVRFSIEGYSAGNIQVEVGDTVTAYKTPLTKYIDTSTVIDGSSIAGGTVTGNKVAMGTISPEKCTFFQANLYDPDDEDVEIDKYLNHNGVLDTYAGYTGVVTGYIPFTAGKMCASINGHDGAGGGYVVLYDANRNIVFLEQCNHCDNIVEWRPGVAYVRFSIEGNSSGNIMVQIGDTITDYIAPNTYALDPDIEVYSNIPDGAVTVSKISSSAVTPEKCTFFKYNLFNPNDTGIIVDYFLYADGSISPNEDRTYLITGFIPFTSGKLCASVNGQTGEGGGYMVMFASDKQTVIWSESGYSCHNVAVWRSGVAYVRFSLVAELTDDIQIEPGDTITDYIPYGESSLDQKYISDKPQYESLLGGDTGTITSASITDGQYLVLTDFPYHLKKNVSLSLHADIISFDTIYFGKGYSVQENGLYYRGQWLKIDGASVTVQYRDNSVIDKATAQHGLTISGFIRVSMTLDDQGALRVVVSTISGIFQHTFTGLEFDMAHSPFLLSYQSTLTNVKMNATCADFRCPVWAIGDSYFDVNRGSWPGWMKEYGYWNFLLDGYPGYGSHEAVYEVPRLLKYGTPKYLLWMLGMNDVLQSYSYNFNEVKAICERKGITLIVATIPTVPTRTYVADITAFVKASGLRYIDVCKAVGADSSGNWYPDFLSQDGVHPDLLGAQAIATGVLADFPELMQYGITD